jgi:hypothetical protein
MPSKNAVAPKHAQLEKNAESLIAESYLLRLDLDPSEILDPRLMPTDSDSICGALKAICAAPRDTVIRFRGRDHIFIWPHDMKPKQGTQIFSAADGVLDRSVHAQIVIAPQDKPTQHIRVTYRLYKNTMWEAGKAAYFLECQGNPTTIFAGNNVVPITTEDRKTGAIEPLPSSSRRSMLMVNRAPFELLKALDRAITGEKATYDPARTNAIQRGEFELVRTQFCCYLPTPNVQRFLQLLTVLYAPLVTEAEGMINLAEHLGLKVKHFTDTKHRITGIQFQWRHGKKLVTSLVFYDKRKRLAQMRQGKTLSEEEIDLVHENVRFDITLHKRGIEQFVGGARRELAKKRVSAPTFLDDLPAKAFLEGKPRPTMWWFEKAVVVYSTSPSEGQPERTSFADWLVSTALGDMLRLTSLVKCTPAALHVFAELDEPVVKAWRQADKFEAGSWAKQIIETSGLEKTTVYGHRKRLLTAYGIDIAIPYPFYRDMVHHGPKSLTTPENREAMNQALGKTADKQEVWRLLQQDVTNFFTQLVEVVGATVSSRPTHLPMKVIGPKKVIGKISDAPVAVPSGQAPARAPTKVGLPLSVSGSKSRSAKEGVATRALKGAREATATAAEAQANKVSIQSIGMPKGWNARKSTLPEGIDRQSSKAKLLAAWRAARKLSRQKLPDRVSSYLSYRIDELERLIERRKGITKQQVTTRAENKADARLKRMGGPLPRLPAKRPANPPKPDKPKGKK